MRPTVFILAFTMAGCDKKQETAPINATPPANAMTGTPKLVGSVTYKLADEADP